MTLDSSALVAILFSEAGHLDLVDRILDADAVRVGAPTLAETTIIASATLAQARAPFRRGSGPGARRRGRILRRR
jgi:uncharacterized protein with PIN domain